MKHFVGLAVGTVTACTAAAQRPQLIFQSGFEPQTHLTMQTSTSADIVGTDHSLPPPNDWTTHLEGHPQIGTFAIQYQGGDTSMRIARIVPEPGNPSNHVLEFQLLRPNVNGASKGRIQANLYGNTHLSEVFYSARLRLATSFDTLRNIVPPIHWLTLMEFWNNPNWTNDPFPFRITLNLQKPSYGPGPLHFYVHGQVFDSTGHRWITIWDSLNTAFDVPTGQWLSLEVYFKEGDSAHGRFRLDVSTDEGERFTVCDIHHFTHHPDDPAPDGLTHFNPFKLYTSGALIDSMTAWRAPLTVWWDDFQLWNGMPTSGWRPVVPPVSLRITAAGQGINIQLQNPGGGRFAFTLFDMQGRHRFTAELVGQETIHVPLSTGRIYGFQLIDQRSGEYRAGTVYFPSFRP